MITIDFETKAIVGNPIVNPPEPVGVAIYVDGQEPQYYDIHQPEIRAYLERVWSGNEQLLFHNAAFDLAVADKWLGLRPPWSRVHDTMPLLFLNDPYGELSLKPAAEKHLALPPDEQDDLRDWILRIVRGATRKNFGAYISEAPYDIVAPYAIGDVVRTRQLYDVLRQRIAEDAPYERERRLAPILYEGTKRGIRVDRAKLGEDIELYSKALVEASHRIRLRLGSPDLNIDSPAALANALDAAGAVTGWKYTEKGARSTSKDALRDTIKDPELLELMLYRSALDTCLGTFMTSWYSGSEHDNRIHTAWNSVRSSEGKRSGTRTGRLSSSGPNFQNVPNSFGIKVPEGLPPLPRMRLYLLPEENHVWLKRDFSSQELRILAHFEEGQLAEAYRADPKLDPHSMAQRMIHEASGILYDRKYVKITAFSIVYGSGVGGLADQLHVPRDEASQIKNAYLDAFPGVRDLQYSVTRRGRMGQPIRTWGGRHYFTEPDHTTGRDYSYKLLNYLIQGSAADQTKQVIIDWDQAKADGVHFLATVHDEINISAPIEIAEKAMRDLKTCMEQDLFDVPMLSEGFVGPNWSDLTDA